MRKMIAAALAALALAGCAGGLGGAKGYTSVVFVGVNPSEFGAVRSWPDANTETTVQVGETMIAAYLAPVVPAVALAAPYRGITQYRGDLRMAVDVPAATLEVAGHDTSGGRFYAAPAGVRLAYEAKGRFDSSVERFPGGFYVAASGAKSVYWSWDKMSNVSIMPAPDAQLSPASVEHAARKSRFQKQLVYSGISQSTASVLYREFSNDTARPAFSQELKYDLAKGRVIGYQRARFEILEAGNTSIRYRVLSPLEIEDRQP